MTIRVLLADDRSTAWQHCFRHKTRLMAEV